MPRCTGPNMDSGNTGTAAGAVMVVMVTSLRGVQGTGRPRPPGPGGLPVVGCSGGVAAVEAGQGAGRLRRQGALRARAEGLQRGGNGLAGREGVAADDVDGHELGPAAVAGDPRIAGVAGGAQLADVGLEVLGADTGAA